MNCHELPFAIIFIFCPTLLPSLECHLSLYALLKSLKLSLDHLENPLLRMSWIRIDNTTAN
jgi:hypothetical protein